MALRRNTTQRQLVLATIRNNGHLSAMDIHLMIRQSNPEVSLATVYRNLGILLETGQIRMVGGLMQHELYDARLDAHAHFFCQTCGQIMDVEDGIDPAALARLQQQGYLVRESRANYYGQCKNCLVRALNPAGHLAGSGEGAWLNGTDEGEVAR